MAISVKWFSEIPQILRFIDKQKYTYGVQQDSSERITGGYSAMRRTPLRSGLFIFAPHTKTTKSY
ncbi:MAG: hypothetical protein HGB00_09110 [Chlorobiaceae bacterium]|nr:hypothetical protein [Chlorobiaceae bacterium]